MRIHVLSDLHLEFASYTPEAVDADVVILAGDTDLGTKGICWAQSAFGTLPVVYLMGNHEYYGEAYPNLLDDARDAARGSNVHLLENDAITVGDVTFVGATLWTDFALFGYRDHAMWEAEQVMADYRKIRVAPTYRRLRAADTLKIHLQSLAWLKEKLVALKGERVVVVTHHAPGRGSLALAYATDIVSAAFVSDLRRIVEGSDALLWVHGHVHHSYDYRYGSTRVICNPRGYPNELDHGFDPRLVLEI